MKFIYLFFLLSLFNFKLVSCNNEEKLRKNIFKNYNPKIRPVNNYSNPIKMKIGINIKGLESFDQVSETIDMNIWITMTWVDELLTWNKNNNVEYLNIKSNEVWLPDLELYNAAKLPQVYNIKDDLTLFYNGTILYKKPASFSYLCPLNLIKFPYDKQKCMMEFGSWKLSSKYLDIVPFNSSDIYSAMEIDKDFSHNEWNIISYTNSHVYNEYKCCPGELWPVTIFDINMKRNSNKYDIIIIMNIILVLSAFIVSLVKFRLYRRTYILVFIPLTIIWLLQSISYKIPVVGYYYTMQKVLLMSFIFCEILTSLSGILFILYNSFYNLIDKCTPKKKYIINHNKNNIDLTKITDYNSTILSNDDLNRKYEIYRSIKFYDKFIKVILIIVYFILLSLFLSE